ncbi:MAG: tetratricopeptide repeat protein [Burkholderiaceae bacterium]
MAEFRALLLTDVVDSTRLSEQLGDTGMADVWFRHDRLARDLLPLWRGREIDKTDGMLLMFDSAADAAGYAMAYHKGIAGLGVAMQARAGLHVGLVQLRDNSAADVGRGAKPLEVDGLAKPIAARVMSVALPGQTLASAQACMALGEIGPGKHGLQALSHGHWQLQGLNEPIELFQIGDASCAFAPPSETAKAYRVVRQDNLWTPARAIRHSLPAERDGFFGRDQALRDLAERLRSGARLISILGLGGIGKTRLVTRFGWRWLGDFPGGVWFCDLSQARSLDGIHFAVAHALEIPLNTGDPATQLGHVIAGRGQCLMILDNFEQVARHAQETLGKWLDRAADARFLVTTREVLGLPGEAVLALTPLVPAEAAQLFLARAQAARPDFLAAAEDDAAVEPLVKLLDGLPLAIELAAARVRVLTPHMLLERMRERFKLLVSTGGRVDRQAALRTVFDWSWELLTQTEKSALAQLSVFEGGMTLEAAEAVLDLGEGWVVDALQSLVQKSFIHRIGVDRFGLLVSVQEYAAEHLHSTGSFDGSGLAAERAAQQRHGAHFANIDEAKAESGSADLDNFVAACRRAVARTDSTLAVALLERSWATLRRKGPFRVGAELATQVLGAGTLDAASATQAHWVAGNALQLGGRDAEGLPHFEAALALAREADDIRSEARALRHLADLGMRAGRTDDAHVHYRLAMQIASDLRDDRLTSDVHNGLGNLAEGLGNIGEARSHYELALAAALSAGDLQREGSIQGNLGLLCGDQGHMDEALERLERALQAARETGHLPLAGNTLCNLGMLCQLLERPVDAQHHLTAALDTARALGHPQLECNVLCNLGIVCESLAQHEPARAHYEQALQLARELQDAASEGQFLGYLGLLHARQSRHDEARRCLEAGQSLLTAVSDQISLAVLQCSRAEAEHLAGNGAGAMAAVSAAEQIGTRIGAGPASEIGQSLARVRALIDSVPE